MSEKKKRIPWNKGKTKNTDPRIAAAELKRQETCIQKYGLINVMLTDEVQKRCGRHEGGVAQKALKTIYEEYGDKAFNEFSKKAKETKLELYGDENFNNLPKRIQTCLEKYGVSHPNKK